MGNDTVQHGTGGSGTRRQELLRSAIKAHSSSATAGLSAPEIAQPIRSILARRPDVTVLMDNVVDLDLASRQVFLENSALRFDYLVLALGGVTSYFGHPEWEEFAPG